MRGPRGSGKAAPSSPSVDALAAIAARKAAKIEKSLNKVPAMQLIADQLAKENALKARKDAEEKGALVATRSTAEDAENGNDTTSDDERASSTLNDNSESEQLSLNPMEGISGELCAPSSINADQDIDMVDADILADFDLDSGSEKEFFLEQLRIAPPEEVDMLLSSLKRTLKPATQADAPLTNDDATESLLKLEVAAFAQKRAAAIPQGAPTKEQLNDFKEEVYMYGSGLNLGETQALLAASRAEADILKARGIKATKKPLALPVPPVEAIGKTIEHFTKIQEAVGELFKAVPQLQTEMKPATASSATVNKRKRGRASKSAAGVLAESGAPASEVASKRQKTSPKAPSAAPSDSTKEQAVTSSDLPKLTRKQKQELYRQELEKTRPVIAKKVVPTTASALSALPKVSPLTTQSSSSAPATSHTPAQQPLSTGGIEPAQRTRQRGRKSATQKQTRKAASSAAPALPLLVGTSAGPKASTTAADSFVDMRAPKKKKRGRKSTGSSDESVEMSAPEQAGPVPGVLPNTPLAETMTAPASESRLAPTATVIQEVDKDKKNKSKRQNKINKKKSVGTDVASVPLGSTAAVTPAKHIELALPAKQAAAVKQTPIPPPTRSILPPQAKGSALKLNSAKANVVKATPTAVQTPATRIITVSTSAILPPSSVSKLVLQKSPAVAAAIAPILPGATPKTALDTPLAGISAPNSSSQGRKRGPRKSEGATVHVDAPKENKV